MGPFPTLAVSQFQSHLNILYLLLPDPAPLPDVPPGPLHEGPDVESPRHQRVPGVAHIARHGKTPLTMTVLTVQVSHNATVIFRRGSVSGFSPCQLLTNSLTGSPKFKPPHVVFMLHMLMKSFHSSSVFFDKQQVVLSRSLRTIL